MNPEQLADAKQRVLGAIDRDEVVQIACDLTNIHSPTGFEQECAEYIIERYDRLGINHLPQQLEDNRKNAIGIVKGTGGGPCLMLNGHMDTSYVGNEDYLPDRPGYKPKAVIDDDWIYGLGIYNMKGGLASMLHACEVIKRLGIELPGDIMLAAVCGEIEKSAVNQYQGALYRGAGCGSYYAITHGAIADFAVIGEPTGMTLLCAHGGFVWTRITLVGDPKHSIFGEVKDNTIHNMLKICHAIEEWGEEYEKRHTYMDMGAKVTLSALEGGWPYRCSRVPLYCSVFVDTRIMPGQRALDVQRELETLVTDLCANDPDLAKLDMEMQVYANQSPSECPPEEYIHQAMLEAHEEVIGEKCELRVLPYTPDSSDLVAHGIPTLNYGPTGRIREAAEGRHYGDAESDWNPSQGEHVNIDDLYNSAKVYAALALNTCSRTRLELGIKP